MVLSAEAPNTKAIKRLADWDKVNILRSCERYCYQITWFMLRDEKQAVAAAKQILMQMYDRSDWFELEEDARLAEIKYTALKHSLEYRKQFVGGVQP